MEKLKLAITTVGLSLAQIAAEYIETEPFIAGCFVIAGSLMTAVGLASLIIQQFKQIVGK